MRRRRRRRRLNKTAVILGALVLAALMLVAFVALTYQHKDPAPFLAKAEAAMAEGDYEAAVLHYRKALGATRVKVDKVDLLFKLARAYARTDQWPKVMACWNQVVIEEPGNIKARLALLQAAYVQADSQSRAGWQVGPVWREVGTQASDLLEIAQAAGVLAQRQADWQTLDGDVETADDDATLERYLHLARGRAVYEQAQLGAVTDPNQALAQARTDLEAVLERDDGQVDAYWYLAQVITEQGEIRHAQGDRQARPDAARQADTFLARAVENAPQDVQAHTYLLEARLNRIRTQTETLEQRRGRLNDLEKDYQALVARFPERPAAFSSQARLHWMQAFFADPQTRPALMASAIAAARRATDLAPARVDLWLALGELHFRQAMMTQAADPLKEAIAVGHQALASPEAQETSGPRNFANKANRLSIHAFLAHCSIEHMLLTTPSPDADIRTEARQAVAQVAQLLGSEDDPEVAKWRGMLALAEGQPQEAVRGLYAVYEKTRASHAYGRVDPVVGYALARACLDTPELGKALEFLSGSLKSGLGYIRPHVILDYLDLLGRLDMWSHVLSQANAYGLDSYEQYFGVGERSRALRIRALIGTQRWQKAEAQLSRLPAASRESTTLRLLLIRARLAQARIQNRQGAAVGGSAQAQVHALEGRRAELVRQQLQLHPDHVDIAALTQTLQAAADSGTPARVADLVTQSRALAQRHAAVGFYHTLLQEPDPGKVSPERRRAIEEQALQALADPIQRGLEMGRFYQRHAMADRALDTYRRLIETKAVTDQPQTPEQRVHLGLAASLALGLALERDDDAAVQQIVRGARQGNLDGCQGTLFEAQVSRAHRDYERALERINACLDRRPLYSQAYLLRSQILTALERFDAALADLNTAVAMNPLDPLIAKAHALGLLARNRRLSDRASEVQTDEAVRALERALRLQPADTDLLGLYAQHTVDRDPGKAVAIYQALADRHDTLEHALTLGDLATHAAGLAAEPARRDAYYRMADAAYAQAAERSPRDPRLLKSYARFYRLTGQDEKAAALLAAGQDETLLWQHFLRRGDAERARAVLEKAYRNDPRDESVIRGLLTVAQQQQRADDVERYSRALVEAADTLNNRIEQITALLRLGKVQEAEAGLVAAGQRFPDEPRVVLLEGWVSLRLGRLDHALNRIEASLQADRDSAVAWYLRGQVHLLQGEADTAIEDLRRSKVLQDSPTTRLTLAKALLQARRRDEAIGELRQAVTEKHAPRQARQLLEELYVESGRTGELQAFYAQMQRLFPEAVYWLNRAGAWQLQQGRFQEAADLYRRGCERKRSTLETNAEAVWLRDVDFRQACQGYFQALLGLHSLASIQSEALSYRGTPFEAMTRLFVAEAHMKRGQRAEALNEMRQALGLDLPTSEWGPLVARMVGIAGRQEILQLCDAMTRIDAFAPGGVLGRFYLLAGEARYDEALAVLDRYVQAAAPEGDRLWLLRLERVKLLTNAYEKTTQAHYRDQAIAGYESLLDKWPTNSNVLNNLAYLLAGNQDRLSEALQYAQQAWAAAPNNPVILDTYGYVLLKDGQYQRAVELLSAARQQYEQRQSRVPPQVFEHLGQAWEGLGEKEKARQAFEQALTATPRALTTRAQSREDQAIGR